MDKILEKSRYIVLIAVAFSLFASASTFVLGAIKTLSVTREIIVTYGSDPFAAVALIELMDTFLIATALFIFSLGLYELFIKDINLPAWLVIHNLHDLKAKLSSVMILVMAVTFLKHLVEWKDPLDTLFFGVAVAIVVLSLIAFSYFGVKD